MARTIIWYEAAKPAEKTSKAGKAGAVKTGTAKAAPAYTTDVKQAATREDGLPIVHHVEIRGDSDGTD